MSNLKKLLIYLGTTLLSIFIILIVTTTLYYFNILSPNVYNIIKLITLLLSLFINAYLLGQSATKKGYLEGLKLSGLLTTILLLCALLTSSFTFKLLLYYLIITITTIFGSMVGISRKQEK